MSDRNDIEETLKRFRHDPDARVKHSVMSAHASALDHRNAVRFWKRPIPLYAAAAALVVLIGVSFVAGQRTVVSDGAPFEAPLPADGAVTSLDLEWSVAERDLL